MTYERKIRYSDTDAQGIVFNANYSAYFDDALTDFFDLVDYRWDGIELVLARIEIDFRSPARLGETVVTGLRVARIGTTSVHIVLAGWESEAGRPVVDARQVQVTVSASTFEPVPVPPEFVSAVETVQGPFDA